MPLATQRLTKFGFAPHLVVADKYRVLARLGGGWEGETYLLREISTRVDRAGKFFFPQRNRGDRSARRYAQKLHKLSSCPMIISYQTRERVSVDGVPVTLLVSEYVRGESLDDFLRKQPGGRLTYYPALHLLRALAGGLAEVHCRGEYHGDLHSENVLVERFGLGFDLKVLDLHDHGPVSKQHKQNDILDLVRLFYDAVGGPPRYARQPQAVKDICRGLKRGLILERFPSAQRLVVHLDQLAL